MAGLTWSFSQAFASQFQATVSGLQYRIDEAKVATSVSDELVRELSAGLAKLTKGIADATGSLPSYDQKQYEEQVKSLEKSISDLRSRSKPKPKFAFKRKIDPSPSSPTPRTPSSAETTGKSTEGTAPVRPDLEAPTNPQSLSSRSHEYLSFESLPQPTPQDITIHDLDQCLVSLISPQQQLDGASTTSEITSFYIKKLSNTILILPPINGTVLLHDLNRCTIIVGCHQFRLHNSQNVDVYLSVASNPVIEHCSDIRFGNYPNLPHEPPKNNGGTHFSVLDFSHIKSTPSPNWSMLNEDRLANQWPLTELASQQELDVLLDRMLPSGS